MPGARKAISIRFDDPRKAALGPVLSRAENGIATVLPRRGGSISAQSNLHR